MRMLVASIERVASASTDTPSGAKALLSWTEESAPEAFPALPPYFHHHWSAPQRAHWNTALWDRYCKSRVSVLGQRARLATIAGLRRLLVDDTQRMAAWAGQRRVQRACAADLRRI